MATLDNNTAALAGVKRILDASVVEALDALSLMQEDITIVTGLGALLALACKAPDDVSPDSIFAIGECVTNHGERIEQRRHAIRGMVEAWRGAV